MNMVALVKKILPHFLVRFLQARLDAFYQSRQAMAPQKGLANKTGKSKADNSLALLSLRNQLLTFKERFPVNLLKDNEEYLWPALRFAIWRGLRFSFEKNKPAKLIPLKTTLDNDWYDYYTTQNYLPVTDIVSEPVDFLFLSNFRGTEQTEFDGKIYNRITDPVFEVAQQVGTAKKIEIIKGGSMLNPARFNETTFVLPPQKRTVGYMNEVNIPSSLNAKLTSYFPKLERKSGDLNAVVEWHFRDRDLFYSLLKKYKPKAVFFIGFEFHLALCSAAHDLGIKTVDLQHGLQTGWGPLYKWWEEMPKEGYAMLPDYFAVWGERDRKHLTKEITSRSPHHQVVVTGYPWIERQFEFNQQMSASLIRKMQKYKRIVLVSLQHQNVFPHKIAELLSYDSSDIDEESFEQNCSSLKPDEVLWLIRKHPKGRPVKKVSELNKPNIVISDEVNELPLGMLLQETHVHITSSSTVVIEADYFGVQNYILDSDDVAGCENYAEEISNGVVRVIATPKDFFSELDALDVENRTSQINAISSPNIHSFLDHILMTPKNAVGF